MVENRRLVLSTKGKIDVINITDLVSHELKTSSINNGQAHLFCIGSTGALSTVEYEPGLVKDIREFFDGIIPYGKPYHHHNTWHDDNGSSHLQATLLKPNLSIPIEDGNLILGTWQQIIFVDFDTRSRKRTIHCQFMGE
jgi:secondary thiamine-phosphate synthase enzyme